MMTAPIRRVDWSCVSLASDVSPKNCQIGRGSTGIVIKAMFFLLKPHSSYSLVIPDNDTTDSLSLSHQYHWVIQSDPSVQFRVNNVSSHWSEGNIYELNNKMINEVYNDTDIPRIHFINKH